MKLTATEREELSALMETNDVVGASFIMRNHWRESGYCSFVRSGLVKWGKAPSGFDNRRFAGVEITPVGRQALKGGSE